MFSTDELEQDLTVRIKSVGDELTKVQCPKRVIGGSGPVATLKNLRRSVPLQGASSSDIQHQKIVRKGAGHVRKVTPRGMRNITQEQEWYLFIVLTATLLLKKMPVMIQRPDELNDPDTTTH